MPRKKSDEQVESKKPKNANGEGSIYQIQSGPKKGKWVAQITIGTNPETGKPVRKSLYGRTRTEVKSRMKLALAEVERGVDLQKQAKLTFGDWILTWMDEYKKTELRLSTWENYYRTIRFHIHPTLGHISLKDLSTDNIQRLYNKLTQDGAAPATVRRHHQIIHSCLKQAKQNRLISWNPAESVKLPKLETREVRAMTPDEMGRFLSILDEDRWGAGFLCLLGTGIRQGELLALRWQDLDLTDQTLKVVQALSRTKSKGLLFEEPKTAKSKRIIPLPCEVVKALRRHKVRQAQIKLVAGKNWIEHDLVFCTDKGTPIYPRNFTTKFYKLKEKTGIPKDVNLHALRHTYATRLLEEGENLKVVQELLGHTDISTTANTYSYVSEEIKRKAAVKLDKLLTKRASSQE